MVIVWGWRVIDGFGVDFEGFYGVSGELGGGIDGNGWDIDGTGRDSEVLGWEI